MAQVPPFGIILPSRPVITNPLTISPTQYAFTIPSAPPFSHVVVFLVPGNVLPPNTLAAVYIQFPGSDPEFKLLGAIGNDKQTAIFKINNGTGGADTSTGISAAEIENEMTDDTDGATQSADGAAASDSSITIGIAVESAATIEAQLASLKSPSAMVLGTKGPSSTATAAPVPTKVLAQRIIKNAFNFLASFAGQTTVGREEMVPLSSFRGWWEKFERRVENDPGFLEREADA
ncbi:MAG: hypothetical protein LQ339_002568 [Xanthoria mediterranea]|nr:MAG: hypothetical protein LQ339_002568 [Xanthoria mediterranea]